MSLRAASLDCWERRRQCERQSVLTMPWCWVRRGLRRWSPRSATRLPRWATGFLIRRVRIEGRDVLLVAARRDVGVLYGTFHLLRLLQRGMPLQGLDVRESPRVALRVLDHWDNLDRYVERGCRQLLWDWQTLPQWRDPRYTDYARATPRSASTAPSSTTSTPVR